MSLRSCGVMLSLALRLAAGPAGGSQHPSQSVSGWLRSMPDGASARRSGEAGRRLLPSTILLVGTFLQQLTGKAHLNQYAVSSINPDRARRTLAAQRVTQAPNIILEDRARGDEVIE